MDSYEAMDKARSLLYELYGYLGNRRLKDCRNATQKKHFDEYAARCKEVAEGLDAAQVALVASNQP